MRNVIIRIVTLLVVAGASVWAGGGQEGAGVPEGDERAAGQTAVGVYSEAPMLAELVAAGELPPVDERLPEDPAVVEPPVEIGQYGGVIKLVNGGPTEWSDFGSGRQASMGWFKLDWDGNPYGELASGYELSDDLTTWTIYFRRGVRWSDGDIFDVDDILFSINDMWLNEEFAPSGYSYLQAGGEYAEITRIDDYTIEFKFAVPHPAFMGVMTSFRTWQQHMSMPSHYLKRWHPRYNDDAAQLAADEGFDSWVAAIQWHMNVYSGQNDLDLPRLDPWKPVRMEPTRMVFERNPYFFKVDPEGNQLPYLDGMDYDIIENSEVITLNVINGDYDLAFSSLSLKDYPVMKEKEQNNPEWPFKVFTVPNGISTNPVFEFVQGYSADPVIAELITDQRFREAFSYAIDRGAINEIFYFGLARPNSAIPINEGAPYYDQAWEEYMSGYDPQRAAELLAEIGLIDKDRDGLLLMSDGRPLNLLIETNVDSPTLWELLEGQLESVGIGIDIKIYSDFPQLVARAGLNDQIQIHASDGYGHRFDRAWGRGFGETFHWAATGWGEWFTTGGADGIEPPQHIKEWMELYRAWQSTVFGSEEHNRIGEQVVWDWLKHTYQVGLVGYTPNPVVIRDTVGNVVEPPNAWGFARDTMSQWRETAFLRQE